MLLQPVESTNLFKQLVKLFDDFATAGQKFNDVEATGKKFKYVEATGKKFKDVEATGKSSNMLKQPVTI